MACNILDGTDCDACLTGTVITRERVYTNGTKNHEVRCDTCNGVYYFTINRRTNYGKGRSKLL